MEIKKFVKFLYTEAIKKVEKYDITQLEPPLVTATEGDRYSGGRKLHPNLPTALNHNGKNMFYSFDLTNKCNRGCPGCYVDRAKEISCNAVSDIPLKEYKGDLRKWDALAKDANYVKKNPEYPAQLADAKKQINANGGIRMFSAADYPQASDPEYVEYMSHAGIDDKDFFRHQVTAFLDDAKATGWHIKAITKELNFLKDHVHHEALKGVDVSMNAQGFGESHELVKALKHGDHNHKSLSEKDKEKLKIFDHKDDTKNDAADLVTHSDKIIGRTVTHTPFDLLKMLEHKNDHKHIGVITSGHDIPGNGVRYVPSKPKEPFSPKTIIIQTNFPEKLMHILDGDVAAPSNEEVASALNEYVKKYNDVRDKAKQQLDAGEIEVLNVKDNHAPDLDIKKYKARQRLDAIKAGKVQEAIDKKGGDFSSHEDEFSDDASGEAGQGDEGAVKDPENRKSVVLKRIGGVWYQMTHSLKGDFKRSSQKTKANLIPNIEEQFDIINPKYTQTFTSDDAKFLMSKMEGKMCCAGEQNGKEAKGKCHTCKAKCGVKGCGSNVEKDEKETKEVQKESRRKSFFDMIVEKKAKTSISGSYEIEELEVKDGEFKGFWNVELEVEIEYDDGNVGDFNTPIYHPNMGGHHIDDVEITKLEKYDEHLQDYHKVVLNPHLKAFFSDIARNSKYTDDIIQHIVGEQDEDGDDYSTASGKSN